MSSEVAADSTEQEKETPQEQEDIQIPIPAEMQSDLEMTHPVVRMWISKKREILRPWSDFFRTAHFDIPKSPVRLCKRVSRNLDHFQSNYAVVFLLLSLYCFVADPLLILAGLAYGIVW